ncbi:MAG TPA: hypothetical protein VH394_03830 [Thermoanaerobaculia bacterium]|jgi:hypothetical protein|nr:hypothetical protein [Thermoanaerobaculia bacterium]
MTRKDLADALAWLVLSAVVLSLIPIGYVSADGIGQSLAFAAGFQRWNPNHLLVEPLGAGWLGLLIPGFSRAEGVDHLKRLCILAGALAIGLFRFGVAGRLASSRLAANHGTAWIAASSAFSRLWISDEIHMVQMPAVVLVAVLALRYLDRPTLWRAALVGASVTLAAAFFLENLLLGPALAVGVLLRKRRSHAAAILGATLMTTALVFGGIWAVSGSARGPLDWMTRYAGGTQPARVESAYGVEPSLAGLAESALRAGYGAACALVDLGSAVAAFRDGLPVGPVVPSLLAFAASLALLTGFRDRDTRLLVGVWATAVLVFGVFWNNSEDQFYVQLSVAFGALAARMPLRPALLVLSLCALLWNVADLTQRRILYPREERLALMRTLDGAGLIVYPGFDEIEILYQLEPPKARSVSFTSLAVQYPAQEGLLVLTEDIDRTLASGRHVVLLDLFDTPRDRSPWKFLRRLGYEHDEVLEVLGQYPAETRRLGPFTLRWVIKYHVSHGLLRKSQGQPSLSETESTYPRAGKVTGDATILSGVV